MKNTNIPHIVAIAIILLMTTACRSTKQMSSTQQTISTCTTQSIDSLAKSIQNTHKTTTSITYLPMQTPGFQKPATPDIPAPIQDLAETLIAQGGGTLIITQEETTQNDTTTIKLTTQHEQTQNESENQETQSQSNPPRASPIINRIFYIFLAAAFILLLLDARHRQ
ncbi:MAG: hypothetical protein IK006_02505 [Bacteroidaceae bacterium]|nr:hypothetical protein [Bacteroidaceae bacterium]